VVTGGGNAVVQVGLGTSITGGDMVTAPGCTTAPDSQGADCIPTAVQQIEFTAQHSDTTPAGGSLSDAGYELTILPIVSEIGADSLPRTIQVAVVLKDGAFRPVSGEAIGLQLESTSSSQASPDADSIATTVQITVAGCTTAAGTGGSCAASAVRHL